MNEKRILVAGVGNIFHGDDAFGVVVANRLLERPPIYDVEVVDFGIRGYDLAFAILSNYEAVILVDTSARGREPGTLYLIDPELDGIEAGRSLVSGHSMNPEAVLGLLDAFGGYDGRLYVVGCEPYTLESVDGKIGLSETVEAAVEEAISMIERLVESLLAEASVAGD